MIKKTKKLKNWANNKKKEKKHSQKTKLVVADSKLESGIVTKKRQQWRKLGESLSNEEVIKSMRISMIIMTMG